VDFVLQWIQPKQERTGFLCIFDNDLHSVKKQGGKQAVKPIHVSYKLETTNFQLKKEGSVFRVDVYMQALSEGVEEIMVRVSPSVLSNYSSPTLGKYNYLGKV